MEASTSIEETEIEPLEQNIGTKTIDNTAPLSQLVDDFYGTIRGKSKKGYSLYWKLLAQRQNDIHCRLRIAYHYAVPGHPLNAFSKKYDGTTYYDYFEEFQYRGAMPKYITQITNIGKSDPVAEPLKIRTEWKDKVAKMRSALCLQNAKSKVEKLNDDVIYCPKYIVDLAAALDDEPLPLFDDSYNWHYAGSGNMQMVCIHWVDYLLYSQLNYLYISRFYKETTTVDVEESISYDCGHNILETICSKNNIVALRTMNKIFILKIKELDSTLSIEKLASIETGELPFTAISFDKHHTNILYITQLDCKLSIVNLDRMSQKNIVLRKSVEVLQNNWNRVIGTTRGNYMHIEKNCITSYDKRTNTAVNSWEGVKGIVDEKDCNNITAAEQPEDSHSLYFTTDHHLFLMDARCSSTRKLKVVQRWTHGMQCIPTYITVGDKGNKQFIFLSSQWCEDLCVVSNYTDRLTRTREVPGVAIPYHPPSIFDVLDEARQKLLCWDIQNPIDERLVTSITGKVELQTDDGFTVLMQNSLGDISLHILYPVFMDTFMENDSDKCLHEWSKSYKIDRKDVDVSGIYDISNVWKKLRRIPDDYRSSCFGNMKSGTTVDQTEIYKSFNNDELMPELLEVWVANEERMQTSSPDLNVTNDN